MPLSLSHSAWALGDAIPFWAAEAGGRRPAMDSLHAPFHVSPGLPLTAARGVLVRPSGRPSPGRRQPVTEQELDVA